MQQQLCSVLNATHTVNVVTGDPSSPSFPLNLSLSLAAARGRSPRQVQTFSMLDIWNVSARNRWANAHLPLIRRIWFGHVKWIGRYLCILWDINSGGVFPADFRADNCAVCTNHDHSSVVFSQSKWSIPMLCQIWCVVSVWSFYLCAYIELVYMSSLCCFFLYAYHVYATVNRQSRSWSIPIPFLTLF